MLDLDVLGEQSLGPINARRIKFNMACVAQKFIGGKESI
jgi:hypothetical protein